MENPENIPPWCLLGKGMAVVIDILLTPTSPSLLTKSTGGYPTDDEGKRREKQKLNV